jgi:diguanylate cyclase (GGDEF)-like protein
MGRDFTMLMLDLDDLKPVNDTFGHQWGDRLLKAVADAIRQTIRFTDAAARYGGDEFVILLPETDAAGGYVVAEKLRRDIAALTLRAADRNVRSSVSVGLVTYPHDGGTIEQLVSAADVAMYESKRRGKNRIVGYQTRTERIATAIDIETAETVAPASPSEVRTGGDPAPWSVASGAAAVQRSRSMLTELSPGSEPQVPTMRPGSPSEARGPRLPEAADPPSAEDRPPATRDSSSAPAAGTEQARGAGTAGDAAASMERAGSSGRRSVEQPWLTRTDERRSSTPGPTPGTGASPGAGQASGPGAAPGSLPPTVPGTSRPTEPPQPPGDSSGRPAADKRSSRAPGGRPASRSEEIREPRERPWIALPIEPWEPPERPKS